jgi:16S rRNA (cytosine967-C5)-methyltransferase
MPATQTFMHPKTIARKTALHILVALETQELIFPQALNLTLPQCPPETRPLARELASGVLRHRALLDWTLAPLLKKPLPKLDAPVRAALRLAAYERAWMKTFPAVVANEYAGLMKTEKLSSATGFVNAIARRLPETPRAAPDAKQNPATHLATKYSHPAWLAARWLTRFGFEECEKLLQCNNCVAPLALRVNTLRATRDEVLRMLQARDINVAPGVLSPDAMLAHGAGDPVGWPEWGAGKIIAQDEAAQLVSLFAAPLPGQLIVDCAAAPGGKSTHLAQLMENTGKIIACDLSVGRLKLVCENAARLGIENIETHAGDLRQLAPSLPRADLVLLDAPCSGTGTLRRRPDAKWNKTPQQLTELVLLQRELLKAAASLVKPGGVLVYSTCSIEPEENENQIEWWQNQHPAWHAQTRSTLPHRDGCDGMFAARLTKP